MAAVDLAVAPATVNQVGLNADVRLHLIKCCFCCRSIDTLCIAVILEHGVVFIKSKLV